ncbi:adenylate/guanylate cyclase domain-containing protein [Roseibium sp. SCP14]|uniref:adenylate/guanylate cyclase domain-containing protein n=1 Tax=Roseibium sp. SCP14 TaxID=3141375 RepID=UPI00333C69CE
MKGNVMDRNYFRYQAIPDFLRDMLKWITVAPDYVPEHFARYHVYWRIFYFLAAVSHALTLLYFAERDIWFMVYFNIFSVSAFTVCLVLLRSGQYQVAFWIAMTELVGHAVAATICVGVDYGALDATMLILILVFVQPFYSLRFSILLALTVLAIVTLTQYYALTHPPIYTHFQVSLADYGFRITVWPILALAMVVPFIRVVERTEKELELAYSESERLLLSILPEPIADKLKVSNDVIADEHGNVAIMFIDIVDFTKMSKELSPSQLVEFLNKFFYLVDDLVEKHKVEKIKTIGDAYMIAAGATDAEANPESKVVALALDVLEHTKRLRRPDTGEPLQVRIGAHSGKVVAGVIGKRKFAYDLWGDTVNLAARMECTGIPGQIQVSEEFANSLDEKYTVELRGVVEAKGRGEIQSYILAA